MKKLSRNTRALLFSFFLVSIIGSTSALLPKSEYKEAIVIGLAVTFFFVFYFLDRQRLSAQEKQAVEKIRQLRDAGEKLAYEREETFNAHDLRQLNTRGRHLLLATIAGIFIFGGIGIFLVQVLMDIEYKLYWQVFVFLILGLGFGFWGRSDIKKYNLAIKTGKKTVVRGIITNKRIDPGESNDHYYLEIDTISVLVKKKVYEKYEIGDGIEVHIFKPRHNYLLYESKLETSPDKS